MITRTIKYTASDGTEHDSPQAAALKNLASFLFKLIGHICPVLDDVDRIDLANSLARDPEALRDAVNAYFDDLEEHPDVEDFGCDPAYFDQPPHPSGLILTEYAKDLCQTATVYDWLAQGWTPKGLIKHGMAVKNEEGEIAPGVRGFEMEVPRGSYFAVDHASGRDGSAGAAVYRYRSDPIGNPEDPSTWSADLPVDHPQYCRPFGTREE